jgi:hypothetical protein
MVRAWRAVRGCVLTKDRTPNLKRPTWVGRFNANPIIVRVRPHKRSDAELGTHKRSCPDLKHLTMPVVLSPDLSAVRVQHPTWVGRFNANPIIARGAKLPPTPELFSFFWYSPERNFV